MGRLRETLEYVVEFVFATRLRATILSFFVGGFTSALFAYLIQHGFLSLVLWLIAGLLGVLWVSLIRA